LTRPEQVSQGQPRPNGRILQQPSAVEPTRRLDSRNALERPLEEFRLKVVAHCRRIRHIVLMVRFGTPDTQALLAANVDLGNSSAGLIFDATPDPTDNCRSPLMPQHLNKGR
jgi:hypothetical protein